MSPIEEDMKIVAKKAEELVRKNDCLKRLLETYPDLQKFVGRWKKVAYYSGSVNGIVTNIDMRHNCGCCDDSPLEIWPFIKTENGNVYSDPPRFIVGGRTDYGDCEYPGWEQKMQEAGINTKIIDMVQAHFDECEMVRNDSNKEQ